MGEIPNLVEPPAPENFTETAAEAVNRAMDLPPPPPGTPTPDIPQAVKFGDVVPVEKPANRAPIPVSGPGEVKAGGIVAQSLSGVPLSSPEGMSALPKPAGEQSTDYEHHNGGGTDPADGEMEEEGI